MMFVIFRDSTMIMLCLFVLLSMFFLVALAASTKDASGSTAGVNMCEPGKPVVVSGCKCQCSSLEVSCLSNKTNKNSSMWSAGVADLEGSNEGHDAMPLKHAAPKPNSGCPRWVAASVSVYKVKRSMLHINLWTPPGPSQEHSFTCRLVIRLRKEATLLQLQWTHF